MGGGRARAGAVLGGLDRLRRRLRRSGRFRPDLGFLVSGLFAAKTPVFRGWKSLDFLGFSRPNLYLSMGYAGKTENNFSWRFLPSRKRRRNG
jgi:hypothetical protein